MPNNFSCCIVVLQNTIHETIDKCKKNVDCVCEYSVTQVVPQFSIKCSYRESEACICLACDLKKYISRYNGCSTVCCGLELVVKSNFIIYHYCSIALRVLENHAIEQGVVGILGNDVLSPPGAPPRPRKGVCFREFGAEVHQDSGSSTWGGLRREVRSCFCCCRDCIGFPRLEALSQIEESRALKHV